MTDVPSSPEPKAPTGFLRWFSAIRAQLDLRWAGAQR
jgi:hypothetical protein